MHLVTSDDSNRALQLLERTVSSWCCFAFCVTQLGDERVLHRLRSRQALRGIQLQEPEDECARCLRHGIERATVVAAIHGERLNKADVCFAGRCAAHSLAGFDRSFKLSLLAIGVEGVGGGEQHIEHDTRTPHVDGAAFVWLSR